MRLRQLIQATENKYNRLLISLSLIYLISPFWVDQPLGDLIVFSFFCLSLIVVIYQIESRRIALNIYLGIVSFALIIRAFGDYVSLSYARGLEIMSTSVFLVLISLSIYLMGRELIRVEQITSDIVKGGICIYFLLGFFWASMYNLVNIFSVNSFNSASQSVNSADLVHFSFTTLTTIGYGDVSPVSKLARVLANLEGIFGVMYPAVFIARLVGSHDNR